MQGNVFKVFNKRLMILGLSFVICHLSFTPVKAQTFTQQVQQKHSGEGTVTIHHDADIDRLVNANSSAAATPAKSATTEKTKAETTTATKKAEKKAETTKPEKKAETTKAEKKAETTKAEKKAEATKAEKKTEATKAEKPKAKPQDETPRHNDSPAHGGLPAGTSTTVTEQAPHADTDTTTTSQPRRAYKTTGYRVQAFAGGNTRRDRQKAERTGNAMRQLFPGEDVYVRFYSPRWVCRVGNYRTYEEAHDKMMEIRKMGYESATIVKGKIIVYYD